MSKIKELWQYAMFRWCVYVTPLLVFGVLLRQEAFAAGSIRDPYDIGNTQFADYAIHIWILIFTLPAVWVWRKPIWNVIGFLNRKAEEG